MIRFIEFIGSLLYLYMLVLGAAAVMSWLIAFNVVNRHVPVVRMVWDALLALTEPLVRPIRRYVPPLAGTVDISFLILFIGIWFIHAVVLTTLIDIIR